MYWSFLVVPLMIGLYQGYRTYGLVELKIVLCNILLYPLLSLLIMGTIYKSFLTISMDIEYHGGYVQKAIWKEHWTEEQTITHTDDKGNLYTTTVYTYHPDAYCIDDSNGYIITINYSQYNYFKKLFNNETKEPSHHFSQSSWGDGRTFKTSNPGLNHTLVPCFTWHRYDNRIRHSHSLFKTSKVDQKKLGLYDYPPIQNNYEQNSLVGYNDREMEMSLARFNAIFGREKQVRLFVLVFPNSDISIAEMQQNYWENGNKNELVVCVGLKNNTNMIKWIYPFSWGNEKLLVDIREDVAEMKVFNIGVIEKIISDTKEGFQRIDWHQFDYIPKYFPWWIYALGWSLPLGVCIILYRSLDIPVYDIGSNKYLRRRKR